MSSEALLVPSQDENIRVFVRVRPVGDGMRSCIDIVDRSLFIRTPSVEDDGYGHAPNSSAVPSSTAAAAAAAAPSTPRVPDRRSRQRRISFGGQGSPSQESAGAASAASAAGAAASCLSSPAPLTPQQRRLRRQSSMQATPGRASAAAALSQAVEPVAARQFTFDLVFNEDSTQDDVSLMVSPVASSVVRDGINNTVLAYGQTGSGKTHTMFGTADDPGVIPRLVRQVFELVAGATDTAFLLQCSFVELYNDSFRNLLPPANGNAAAASSGTGKIVVREAVSGATYLEGPSLRHFVCTADDVLRLIQQGIGARAVSETGMNEASSRSHAIFSLHVESQSARGTTSSVLHLVDLAGSERIKRSGVEGAQQREATHINKSLTALGDVLAALTAPGGPPALVPYRNSKLTFLLRDSLGGSAKTIMIATVRGEAREHDETMSTVRWAARAKTITNHVHANTDPKDSKLASLQDELATLRRVCAERDARLAEAERAVAAAGDARASESAELAARASALARERDESAAERAALEARLECVVHAHAQQLTALGSHTERIARELVQKRAESEAFLARLQLVSADWAAQSAALRADNEQLTQALASERARSASLAAQLDAARRDADRAVAELRRVLEATSRAAASKAATMAALVAENERLTAQAQQGSSSAFTSWVRVASSGAHAPADPSDENAPRAGGEQPRAKSPIGCDVRVCQAPPPVAVVRGVLLPRNHE